VGPASPPDKGGWNILYTWFHGTDVIDPAVHFGLSGAGPNAWFGWPNVPQIEKLGPDWLRTTDQTKRKQLTDEIQKIALDTCPGENGSSQRYFEKRTGCLKFGAPIFRNVKLA
jgi:peptide/nickel transport system substrate-binding protein